jgi:hypothetical protein
VRDLDLALDVRLLDRARRRELEGRLRALHAALDALEGDRALELGGDEPAGGRKAEGSLLRAEPVAAAVGDDLALGVGRDELEPLRPAARLARLDQDLVRVEPRELRPLRGEPRTLGRRDPDLVALAPS